MLAVICIIGFFIRSRRIVVEQLSPASITFGGFFCVLFNFGIVFLTAFFAFIDMLHGRSPFAVPTTIERQAEQ